MRTNKFPVSIIGAGRVGSTLAMLLHRGGYRVVSVISQRKHSARKLAHLVGCDLYSDSVSDIHPATRVVLVAIPEEFVSGIAAEMTARAHLDFPNLVVFHTSGSLTSDALMPVQRKGGMTFSLHPIQSFSTAVSPAQQLRRMKNVAYGFEGNTSALPMARRLVKEFNGTFVQIPKEEKILYHIACVFASNFSVALLGTVEDLVKRIGGGLRLSHFEPLVKASIETVFQSTPHQALTGPIVRGSSETVEQHMRELWKTDPPLAFLYQQIGLQALTMAVRRKSLNPTVAKQIRQILNSKTIVKENH